MRKNLLSGMLLAVFAALIVALGQALGLDLQHVALLGAALGGVLGLVPHPNTWGRVVSFLIGFVVAWLGFGLRAALLPDSATGRAVAAFLVVAIVVLVVSFSKEFLPLWAGLLGAAAMTGAYEAIFTNAPSQFLTESPIAATTMLLAVALGYLAVSIIPASGLTQMDENRGTHRAEPQVNQPVESDLEGLLSGEKK